MGSLREAPGEAQVEPRGAELQSLLLETTPEPHSHPGRRTCRDDGGRRSGDSVTVCFVFTGNMWALIPRLCQRSEAQGQDLGHRQCQLGQRHCSGDGLSLGSWRRAAALIPRLKTLSWSFLLSGRRQAGIWAVLKRGTHPGFGLRSYDLKSRGCSEAVLVWRGSLRSHGNFQEPNSRGTCAQGGPVSSRDRPI